MNFTSLSLKDIVLIEPICHGDKRGYFLETFRLDLLEKFLGRKVDFVQDNESKSSKGVLRGLHYQLPPYSQSKLVRVIEGKVLDVVVDLRRDSKTFGDHLSIELSGENKNLLFIPPGFGHGYIVLSDYAIFTYKVDNYYSPSHDRGIAFNDPTLDINWKIPLEDLRLSEKDKNHPNLIDSNDLF